MIKNKKILTNANGSPIEDDNNSLSINSKEGITAIQDVHLMEKLSHFNREKIPERIVHAKGTGAFGTFTATKDMSKYTRAAFLNKINKKTDIFARFSTVGGEKGSADSERDPRGFAIKFYTEEGNYDMVGNNTPVFFIRDAMKFPDFIHTQKRDPQTNLHDADMFWDFLSLTPESMHQVTILFSDRGTPKDYRHMDGFSSNTYMWYNAKNEYSWIKYHFITDQGNKTLDANEAQMLKATDPDHATRDLFDSIKNKKFPSWTVSVQIMTNEQAKKYRFDPFDVTKVWFHKDFPLIQIGKMELNQNPENFFAEVEQSTFAPSAFVPGIGASPDKLLQGRLFAYRDAHSYRVGINHQQLPVNMPKHASVNTYQRDGSMSMNGNGGKSLNYFPNSDYTMSRPELAFTPPAIEINGVLKHHDKPIDDIDFFQPGELYRRVLTPKEKLNLLSNISSHLCNAHLQLQYRQTALFYKTDVDYGTQVAKLLKLDLKKVIALSSMNQDERIKNTLYR